MKIITLLLFISLHISAIYAQSIETDTTPNKKLDNVYFGIETGIKAFETYCPDYDFMRQEAVYYYDYYSNSIATSMLLPSVAIKAEYRTLHDKLWISTGINYAVMKSEMGKLYDESEYFYLRLSANQSNTNYFRINKISETTHYLGIPVDVRITPSPSWFFRVYFKYDMDINFKIASAKDITFYNDDMEKHEAEILKLFNEPDNFFVLGSFGIGLQWGRKNELNVRLEADLPTFVFTEHAFGITDLDLGGGCNISILKPLKTK